MADNLTSCPKCGTHTGRIDRFRHVEGGVCFCCNGAGQVTEAQRDRWLAAQLRRDLPRRAPVGGVTVTATRRWHVRRIAGLGRVEISRSGDDFTAQIDSDGGPLSVWFTVDGGRVRCDRDHVVNGIRYGMGMAAVERCLQAALK